MSYRDPMDGETDGAYESPEWQREAVTRLFLIRGEGDLLDALGLS